MPSRCISHLIADLKRLRGIAPPFADSVFTTCEIAFCDVPNLSRKNPEATFEGFEALTVTGEWDWVKRGGIIFWEDEKTIALRPGMTVLFPAGTKRYSFVPVAPHETRYIFRQYCHAGVMRWCQKGGRSDTEFDKKATVAEKAAWEAKRASCGKAAAKLYSKLGDIYVF
ncbi:hypothetical protein C8R43DRAFT_906554 [Mycena crocata]|nr:hypothetical protein C8R43DRAFT_906554 [Mycena crocata]